MLTYYRVICEEGSISRAAERLFISKQALSRALKRLEGELGTILFKRAASGLVPTEMGIRFCRHAAVILNSWDQAMSDMRAVPGRARVPLRVGFAYMSYHLWSDTMRAAFEESHPHIALEVSHKVSKLLLEELDEKQLDVAISCMQTDKLHKYDKRLICALPLHATMPLSDPLAQHERITPFDLEGRTVLYPQSGAGFIREFSKFMKDHGIAVEVELFPTGNILTILTTVRESGHIWLSNNVFSMAVTGFEGFVTTPLDYEGLAGMPHSEISAIYNKDALCKAAVQSFIYFFKDSLKFSGFNQYLSGC